MPVYLDEDYNHASNQARHQEIISGTQKKDERRNDSDNGVEL
jgi:hypothetical protein